MLNLLKRKDEIVYFLVPGFMGNYEEGFMKKLYDFLITKKSNVERINFVGHSMDQKKLATLNEMVLQIEEKFSILRKKYSNKKIVVLAHSQGCAISLKALNCFDKKTAFIFFSPAIFIGEVILKRIKEEDYKLLKRKKVVNCQVSRTKKKLIDLKWYQSYKNFLITKEIGKSRQKFLVIRPTDDYIDKKNSDFLLNNLKNVDYLEVKGDHSFEKPKDSFVNLIEKIFI